MYEGEWKDDKRHGYGKKFDDQGTLVYEGEWKEGLPCGWGVVYDGIAITRLGMNSGEIVHESVHATAGLDEHAAGIESQMQHVHRLNDAVSRKRGRAEEEERIAEAKCDALIAQLEEAESDRAAKRARAAMHNANATVVADELERLRTEKMAIDSVRDEFAKALASAAGALKARVGII